MYVFPRQVAFSSANSHNLFRIPSTRLGHPPTNHELITVDEVSKVLVIDEKEKVLLSLQCAKAEKAALEQVKESTEEQDQKIVNLEAKL